MAGTVLVRVVTDTSDAKKGLDESASAIDNLSEKFDKIGGSAAKAAGGFGDVGGVLTSITQMQKDSAAAADNQAKAQIAVQEAQDALTEATKKYGAGSIEAQKAQLALNDAQRAAEPPSALEEWGNNLAAIQPLIMGVAGAMDLLTLATEAIAIAQEKNVISTIAAKAAQIGSSIATAAATAAQWALNAAMLANPIGLIIIALVALAAVFVILWKKSETFRAIVTAAWDGIKKAAMAVFNFLKTFFQNIFNTYKTIFTNAIKFLMSAWEVIKTLPGKVAGWFKGVFDFFNSLPGKLLGIGKNIMRGLLNGINAGFQWIKDKIGAVANFIPGWLKKVLGISSPSRVMKRIGEQTMQGLSDGLDGQIPDLKRTLGNVTDTIEGTSADLNATANVTGVGALAGSGETYITVQVAPGTDPAEVGRQLKKYLDAYQLAYGRSF